MNRPIKFRGKDAKTSHWVYGVFHKHIDITPASIYKDAESKENHIKEHTHYLIIQDAFSDYCMPRNIQCINVTPETVGQFTGLYDKNGAEIYEGDIVRLFDFKNCQVVFERGAFCYATNYWVGPFSSNTNLHIGENGACPEVEIVGNIHDNNIDELIEKIK